MWSQALRRKANRLVEQSEPETIRRAQRTWQELKSYVARRQDMDIEGLEVVHLEDFVHKSEAASRAMGTQRPDGAFNLEIFKS